MKIKKYNIKKYKIRKNTKKPTVSKIYWTLFKYKKEIIKNGSTINN